VLDTRVDRQTSRLGFTATLVQELENEDAAEFRTVFRMDLTAFEELLQMVKPLIEKPGI